MGQLLDRFADGFMDAVCNEKYEYLRPMTVFDGDGIAFRLEELPDKKMRFSTGMEFSERFRRITFHGDVYLAGYGERVRRLCDALGVTYLSDEGELEMIFRRNEMRVGEAYFKFLRAVSVLLQIGTVVFP